VFISNRHSRRKQNSIHLKNNRKPIKPFPVKFEPITDYEAACEATNSIISYLAKVFRDYTHAIRPRDIASQQLALVLAVADKHVRRCANHFSILTIPLQSELATIRRQLGGVTVH
jgi:hypothetical protein